MESSARLLSPATLNGRLLLRHHHHLRHLFLPPLRPINSCARAHHHHPPLPSFRSSIPKLPLTSTPSAPSFLSLSLSLSNFFSSSVHHDPPSQAIDEPNPTAYGEGRTICTVVLLGWLGAEIRHLRRYAEMYISKGFRAVRFVVPVRDFLGFDLGQGIEDRVGGLARELVEWCEEKEREGREPRLLFHTFSNTGWLSYGVILENLRSRSDIIEKIRGWVVDSGPATDIDDPKVWAAGFGAALLKKHSSLTQSSVESNLGGRLDGNINRLNAKGIRPPFNEIIFLFMLEKFFNIVLMLPDVKRRLNRIMYALLKNQPPCPQLYLYSSGDKVVPVQSVVDFMEQQRALGIDVHAHDFVTSPHVDHYRSFPHVYASKVYEFLEACSFPTTCEA